MARLNPAWIIGKTVARVHMRPTVEGDNAYEKRTLHDPLIVFADGSAIAFVAEENPTGGDYGVDVVYIKQVREGM